MRILIVEDDFTSCKLIEELLNPYGHCDVAVNGKEAVKAFEMSLEEGPKYDLICLDIMMPEMDGHAALEAIRKVEADRGIHGLDGVKIIMTTALGEPRNIMKAFNNQCEAYLVKPIYREKLVRQLKTLGLVETSA